MRKVNNKYNEVARSAHSGSSLVGAGPQITKCTRLKGAMEIKSPLLECNQKTII